MKIRYIGLSVLVFIATFNLYAQKLVEAESVKLSRFADSVCVEIPIQLKDVKVDRNEVLLIRPILTSQEDTLELPSVGIYGREQYYYYIRSGRHQLQGDNDIRIREKNKPEVLDYCQTIPYQAWMGKTNIQVNMETNRRCYGVTGELIEQVYQAQPVIKPGKLVVDTIHGVAEGRAYIDFVLDRTEIKPDYHDNRRELAKIDHAIDSLLNDPYTTVTAVTVKGWASPEGPYRHNVELARDRSKALREYIIQRHQLDTAMVSSTYEPEDWPGLREYVEKSNLPHKKQILEIIDSDREPDPKLRLIRTTYQEDFADIFEHSLPYLRHSDFRIDYKNYGTSTRRYENDTLWVLPQTDAITACVMPTLKPFRPIVALKTNLLFDALLAPNIEIEVPFGKDRQWSVMVEDWFPWWLFNRNARQSTNPYRLAGVPYYSNSAKGYRDAYEVWLIGAELRRWLGKCYQRPLLTGTFVGLYVAGGKFDIERKGKGNQGEFFSAGATIGHSWPLAKRWNFEVSASGGVVFGPRRHYHGEFDDTHLIWDYSKDFFYAGPTKLKASIVWLLSNPFERKDKKEDKKALFEKTTYTEEDTIPLRQEGGDR